MGRGVGVVAHRLGEDLVVACILNRLPDFCITGIRPDNSVLPFHLRCQFVPEVAIDLLIFVYGGLQLAVHSSHLRLIARITGLFLLLDILEALCKVSI